MYFVLQKQNRVLQEDPLEEATDAEDNELFGEIDHHQTRKGDPVEFANPRELFGEIKGSIVLEEQNEAAEDDSPEAVADVAEEFVPHAPIQNQSSTHISRADSQVITLSAYSMNSCLSDLKHTTQVLVKFPKPTTIDQVANQTQSHETSNTTGKLCKPVRNTPCFRSTPIPNKPMDDNYTHVQIQNTKPIFNKTPRSFNASEMADKEAKGLCMFCDELFTPENLLKHKRFKLLVMEREEEDESIYEEVEVVDGKALGDCGSTRELSKLDLTLTLSGKLETILPLTVPDVGKEGVPTTRNSSNKEKLTSLASGILEEEVVDSLQVTIQEKSNGSIRRPVAPLPMEAKI